MLAQLFDINGKENDDLFNVSPSSEINVNIITCKRTDSQSQLFRSSLRSVRVCYS